MSKLAEYAKERLGLHTQQLECIFDRSKLPEVNARINELTILINEEKRIIRIQDALSEATEKDVIDFFGAENLLDEIYKIDDMIIEEFMQNIYDARE